MLLDSIEEYVDNVLVKKSYWNTVTEEEEFKKFNTKWSELKKLARIDYDDFKNQREILFVKNDLKHIKKEKLKLDEVRKYYRDRMLQLHALRRLSTKYQKKSGIWRTRRRLKADEEFAERAEQSADNKVSICEAYEQENLAMKDDGVKDILEVKAESVDVEN